MIEEKSNNLGEGQEIPADMQEPSKEVLTEVPAQPPEALPEKEKIEETSEPLQPRPSASPPPIPPQDAVVGEEEAVEETKEQVLPKEEDLIEPKWVKEAKKIIKEEKERPFEEEEEQEDLQIEYIKERFGKQIKKCKD